MDPSDPQLQRAVTIAWSQPGKPSSDCLARLRSVGARIVADPSAADVRIVSHPTAPFPAATDALRPLLVLALPRDPELVRRWFESGATRILFADESDRIGEALRELAARHGLRDPRDTDEEVGDDLLRALILALDAREQETAGHSHRVAFWTLYFAMAAGAPPGSWRALHRGALMHDLGKLAIPDPILLKSGALTPEEWSVMRTHPRIAHELLSQIAPLRAAAEIPLAHHERFDGSGYPQGLSGTEIPLGARLFAIVDVYDALRSARPYKSAMSHARALELIGAERGRHFDPDLCDRFVALPESLWRELDAPDLEAAPFRELVRRADQLLTNPDPPHA